MAFKRVGGVLLVEGLDTSKPAEYISDSASPNNLNMLVERAELRKRPGFSALGATAGERIMGGREFYREATQYVMRVGLTRVDLLSGTTWVDISGLAVPSSSPSSSPSGSPSDSPSDSPSSSPSGSDSPSSSPSASPSASSSPSSSPSATPSVSPSSSPSASPSPSDSPSSSPSESPSSSPSASREFSGTVDHIVSFASPLLSGKSIIVFTNYIDPIKKYDGGVVMSDLGGSPPKCKFLLEYESYLLLAYINDGSTLRTMRVQWSDTGAPETWTGGNSGAKDLVSDEDITGLARFGNYVAVHKSSAIWLGYLVSSTAVFRFDMIATGRGTIANNSIQNLPTGEQIFLCKEGLALFNGTSAPLISSPCLEDLREGINPAYMHLAWSVVLPHLDEYWVGVAIGSQTLPETIFAYNYKTGKTHRHEISNATCGWLYAITSDNTWDSDDEPWDSDTTTWDQVTAESLSKRLIVGTEDGDTLERNVLVHDDNLVAVDGLWESKDFTDEDPSMLVNWGAAPQRHGSMELWARGNSVDVAYSTDAGLTWHDISSVTLTPTYPDDDAPIKLWFKALSTRFRVRFRNNTAGKTFYIKQFMVHGKIRERR